MMFLPGVPSGSGQNMTPVPREYTYYKLVHNVLAEYLLRVSPDLDSDVCLILPAPGADP